MRKVIAITAAILAVSVIGASASAFYVNSFKDKVVFTELDHVGDYKALEGVSVEVNASLNEQLIWNSKVNMSENPKAETKFNFYRKRKYPHVPHEHSGIRTDMTNEIFEPNLFDSVEEPKNTLPKYQKVYEVWKNFFDEIKPGEEKEKRIHYKDIFDYYPFGNQIDLPAFWGDPLYSLLNSNELSPEDQKTLKIYQDLGDAFKIPVIDDEYVYIHAGKNIDGNIVSWGSGSIGRSDNYNDSTENDDVSSDSFSCNTYNVITPNACYFTFDPYTEKGNLVDLSHLTHGYGIYKIPIESKDETVEEDKGYANMNELKRLAPLNTDIRILHLEADNKGEKLLLSYQKDNKYFIDIIDTVSGEVAQTLKIYDLPVHWGYVECYDGYAVINFTEESTEEDKPFGKSKIVVIKLNDNGKYELSIICNEYEDEYPREDYHSKRIYAYNGEKLVMVSGYPRFIEYPSGKKDFKSYSFPEFSIKVYDKTGIIYMGHYANSLCTGDSNGVYNYDCHLYYPSYSIELAK